MEEKYPRKEERSVSQLFSDLTREITNLIRKEVELARRDISENVASLKLAVVSMAAGAVLTLGGFLVLLAAAVLGVNEALHEPWLSALIVGVAVTAIGGILLGSGGRKARQEQLAPTKSASSLREDRELIRRHV